MQLGVVVRNMGPQSTVETVRAAARAADAMPAIADVWVTDHIAIPPDDAEGSGGRYLDPLATLAFLAGTTSRVGLGTAVLVLPYRPPLPTAKGVATVQELSGGRLRLGVGVGWMAAEFRALGVDRARRGARADETLAFLGRCFADDVVEANGASSPESKRATAVWSASVWETGVRVIVRRADDAAKRTLRGPARRRNRLPRRAAAAYNRAGGCIA